VGLGHRLSAVVLLRTQQSPGNRGSPSPGNRGSPGARIGPHGGLRRCEISSLLLDLGTYLRRVGARMPALPTMLAVASLYGRRARSLSLVKFCRSY